MKVIYSTPENDIARVHVGELCDRSRIEFVESVQPPYPREEKWVLIVSVLKGCPVDCPICDAGGNYKGKLTSLEILNQIDYMVKSYYPDGVIPAKKFKIQFARMGDPAFNDEVLKVLRELPRLYSTRNLMPCISTIAPSHRGDFFGELLKIKRELYCDGNFQIQFSIHTTDEALRQKLIPAKVWTFTEIASYGKRFFEESDRKITLNFATPIGYPLDPAKLLEFFDPEYYIVKLTPVNPTYSSVKRKLSGIIDPEKPENNEAIVEEFRKNGYDTILSIGELEENKIGSNCGMYVMNS